MVSDSSQGGTGLALIAWFQSCLQRKKAYKLCMFSFPLSRYRTCSRLTYRGEVRVSEV